MGPPLRSFAADAHGCIMVRVLGPTGYKVVARLIRARKAGSPLIVIPTASSVPSCSDLSRCGLARAEPAARLVRRPTLTASARAGPSEARVGTKKRALGRTKKLMKEERCAALKLLDKKSPIQGNIVPWRTGLHGKNLAQSETLCTWRSSLRGTWEVSLVPGLVPGRLGKANAERRACTRMRSRMRP
jgi:hypothetical protein